MSDHGSSKGKAAANHSEPTAIGFRPQVGMTVEPPKPEDLQKSYASIVDQHANPKGWYGSMSASLSPILRRWRR
jgi:erythrocyte band 7 integral membrane protein